MFGSVDPIQIRFKKLDYNATLPVYKTELASGFDIAACLKAAVTIEPGDTQIIPTGLAVAIPAGYEIQIRSRSGLAASEQLMVLNSPGTIDADYRGEIKIILHNAGRFPRTVKHTERLAQGVLCIVPKAVLVEVDELDATARGDGGFGHTGKV